MREGEVNLDNLIEEQTQREIERSRDANEKRQNDAFRGIARYLILELDLYSSLMYKNCSGI